jgi:hypothetical protein
MGFRKLAYTINPPGRRVKLELLAKKWVVFALSPKGLILQMVVSTVVVLVWPIVQADAI